MKKNVAAALAGALSLSLAAGVVAADKAASDVAVEKTVKAAEGTCTGQSSSYIFFHFNFLLKIWV